VAPSHAENTSTPININIVAMVRDDVDISLSSTLLLGGDDVIVI
jgi:hypothetical protein